MDLEKEQSGSGVYSEEILDFVRTANDFVAWIEGCGEESGPQFIRSSVKHLSKVYYTVNLIEDFEPLMEGDSEKFVTEKDWSGIFQLAQNKLGRYNSYLRIAEDDEFDRSDLVDHTISEDMADLYQDIKDFLMLFRQGIEEIMNEAVWEVKDNFDQYWGEKLLNALHALHKLLIKKVNPEEENIDEGENKPSNPTYDNSFLTRLQDLNEEDDFSE